MEVRACQTFSRSPQTRRVAPRSWSGTPRRSSCHPRSEFPDPQPLRI